MPFDRKKFNTDPAFAEKRAEFDGMTEDALNRIMAAKATEAKRPVPEKGFFETLFTPAAPGEKSFWDEWFGS